MEVIKINGTLREATGKKEAKANRNNGTIPCVLYGGKENVHFTTTASDVRHLIYTPNFKVAEISVNGQTKRAILKSAQFHPVTEAVLHIDFLALIPNTPVNIQVPLRLVGQSPGVKVGGKLVQSMRRVKIKCAPESLVDHLTVDISNLELGQTARVKNIAPVNGVEIALSPSIPVAMVEIPRALRSQQTEAAKAAGKKK